MKRRDLLKHLTAHNCRLLREGGRHGYWCNADNTRRSSIPRHTEINDHTARAICRDLGIAPPPK